MAKKRKPEKLPDMELGMCRCEIVRDDSGIACVCEFTPKEARKFKIRIDDMVLSPKPGIWEKK